MADQRTTGRIAPCTTEGYADAIEFLQFLAQHFEHKHNSLIYDFGTKFLRTEKDNPMTTSDANYVVTNLTTRYTAILKQFQATLPPVSVKAVEEICVTCGGAHPYYQCLAANGNTFPEYRDNIQGYIAVAAGNYKIKAMQTQINNVKNELRNEMQSSIQASMSNQIAFFQMNTTSTSSSGSLPSNNVANPKGELKAITTRSGLVLDGPTVLMPPPFINPEEDERVEETLIEPEHGEYTIKLKCKALADLGASINLMPLLVWKKLGLSDLISTQMTLELANREICTLVGIARDVFILVGKFTFPADFVIINYESDPRVPVILGRPFLRTARALIDVHGEEMIIRDAYLASDSFPSGNSNPSSPLSPFHNSLSGSTTSSLPSLPISKTSDYFLEEFADELAHITFLPGSDDLPFDAESDLREIEYLLNHVPIKEMDSILEDSVNENSLEDNLDDYDDNLFDLETINNNTYDDPFDSKEEKIKDSKILIDELDLSGSSDFLPFLKCDLVFYEDFSEVEALIFNHPLYELPFHKEVPGLGALLSFSFKNEEKVFNPEILTSKRVYSSLLPELSHLGPKDFKVIKIFESPIEMFPCSYGEDIRILDVSCLHFYPL
ncbi:reverse transcriptase domain-containing protein [Tanacetum coccineum]|uniref:Reverse transcriptase domain-containing protein n=1 Tax=Tanacetum coccineum TaxID=301880 RepID=A0ABQ4YK17_9ASTR